MKVCIAGGSGLLGTALAEALRSAGHQVSILSRQKNSSADFVYWNPASKELDTEALEGLDALINLAGDNVATGLWTEAKKKRIRESRLEASKLLSHNLEKLSQPPKVYLNASAIGYYGEGGTTELVEDAPLGDDFLASVCKEWEEAAIPPRPVETRLVRLRIGVILSTKGGALKQALTPFRFGLGGRFGSGKQFFSWISIADAAAAIMHCIANDTISGPVNISGPDPISNAEYTATLARAVQRPAFFHVPAFLLRLLFGQMAEELFLVSARVVPKKLLDSGFTFSHSNIETALAEILEKKL